MTKEDKLEKIDDALARWISRGFRAQNAINKLTKQRKRLVKAPGVVKEVKTELKPLVKHDDLAHMPSNQQPDVIPLPELDAFFIPADLKRTSIEPKAGDPGPKLLSDMINKPLIDAAKRKRLAKMDEKRRGRSQFGPSDMPLTGKDALKAIRAKKAK